jgi:hypothetical protein
VLFEEKTSKNWSTDPAINELFVRQVQNYANDLVRIRGHLFLNEVLDELGLPRTREGQVVGWRKDSMVRFIPDEFPKDGTAITLDFNVDGNILDAIEQ